MNFNGPAIPLPGESFDEEAWIDSALAPEIEQMRQTPQNPEWHAEGDVWTHTKLIIQHLLESDEWQLSEPDNRTILFLAALLHDIGKTVCTRTEEGRITSPNHGKMVLK